MSAPNQSEGFNDPVIDYSSGLPAGAPRRWKFTPVWPVVLAGATTFVLASGAMLSIVAVSTNSVRGATRSTTLHWEQRGSEIDGLLQTGPAEGSHE